MKKINTFDENNVAYTLQQIKEISNKSITLKAEHTKALVPPSSDDIHVYELNVKNSACKKWVVAHTQCFTSNFTDVGIIATVIQTNFKKDAPYCRTKCEVCKKVLNEKLVPQLLKEHETNRQNKKNKWIAEQKQKLEEDKEKVLLGLL